jgi:hypothetical protein
MSLSLPWRSPKRPDLQRHTELGRVGHAIGKLAPYVPSQLIQHRSERPAAGQFPASRWPPRSPYRGPDRLGGRPSDPENLQHLGEANVSANVIMAKTGHKSLRSVQRYVKPGLAAVHAATETLSGPRRRG